VSRHLKALADADWVSSRAEGTSNLYTLAKILDPAARRLWLLVREQVGATTAAAHDQRRLQAPLVVRRGCRRADLLSHQKPETACGGVEYFRERIEVAGSLGARRYPVGVGQGLQVAAD